MFEATYASMPSRPRPPAPAQRVIQCCNRNGADFEVSYLAPQPR